MSQLYHTFPHPLTLPLTYSCLFLLFFVINHPASPHLPRPYLLSLILSPFLLLRFIPILLLSFLPSFLLLFIPILLLPFFPSSLRSFYSSFSSYSSSSSIHPSYPPSFSLVQVILRFTKSSDMFVKVLEVAVSGLPYS